VFQSRRFCALYRLGDCGVFALTDGDVLPLLDPMPPLVSLPLLGSLVVYFLQGHSE
jgi:hypothetical protein